MHRNRNHGRDEAYSARRHVFRPMTDEFEARVLLSDIPVTNTNDAGPGSFREALGLVSTNDRIVFQIPIAGNNYDPATGSWTIVLNSPLPSVSISSINIDGLSQQSQAGAATGHPVVAITPASGVNGDGLTLFSGGNTIQGLVIEGFRGDGLVINGSGSNGNLVTGNFIGTDVTGTRAVPNGGAGIHLFDSGDNTIGGSGAAGRNVIAGNTGSGISLDNLGGFSTSNGNLIANNAIGVGSDGATALGNGGQGVLINGGFFNSIGGTNAGLGNIIANNDRNGVLVDTGYGNAVLSNSIFDNASGGISLANGGNNDQVSPVLTSALVFADRVSVLGTLAATADTGYLVQFFANDPASGQGRTLLGSQTVAPQSTDQTVNLTFVAPATLPAGATITAVASVTSTPVESSDPAFGDTSAFSTAAILVSPFVVTNTNDSGLGSLRFAIQSANGDVNNDDTITFRIPTTDSRYVAATGSWTIPVGSQLTISKPSSEGTQHVVVIDGLTQQSQSGAATTHPVVEITAGSGFAGAGLIIASAGNTVRGLVINGFAGAGVLIDGSGATGNLVTGNFIGTDVTGTTSRGNRSAGVRVVGVSNTISSNLVSGNQAEGIFVVGRGTQVLDNRIGTDATGTNALGNGLSGITIFRTSNAQIRGNTISGNGIGQFQGSGIILTGPGANDNLIVGNFIGTDITGTRRIPNVSDGVSILPGSSGNSVGGTAAGARNVISGNSGNGLKIQGTSNNSVIGNAIGVAADGTTPLGNTFDGVGLSDAPSNLIRSNVISGNGVNEDAAGINAFGARTTGNVISDNKIGTDSSGKAAVGNSLHGIFLGNGASNNIVGPGNVISGNGTTANQGVGVYIYGSDTSGNQILDNLIGTNIDGTARVAGSVIGVLISQSSNNIVQRNVISGNGVVGLEIADAAAPGGQVLGRRNGVVGLAIAAATASGNQVLGNRIGTDKAGMVAIPNGLDGIFINNASNNVIGGAAEGAGNLISGNLSVGIQLFGAQAVGNVIEGNALGLDATGQPTLLNRAGGIFVNTGPANNTIAGPTSDQPNVGQVRVRYSLSGFHQRRAKASSPVHVARRARVRVMHGRLSARKVTGR